jgi:hypothetical protein
MGAYVGEFDDGDRAVLWYVDADGARYPVPHVVAHSPAGLAWGYEGSGPSDTALSILTHITQDPAVAQAWYQEFKRHVVAFLPLDQPFALERAAVERWLADRGVGVAAEWELAHSQDAGLHLGWGPGSALTEQLAQRSAALDAREAALARRERDLNQRERRLDVEVSTFEHPGVDLRWTLPAHPVKVQLQALQRDTRDDLATIARGMNLEPEWAAGVLDGSITEVDLPHVQRICEGLHCTPYDFWGAEAGRSILHAYGPELWPRYIEPLLPPPPDLGGPDLGL